MREGLAVFCTALSVLRKQVVYTKEDVIFFLRFVEHLHPHTYLSKYIDVSLSPARRMTVFSSSSPFPVFINPYPVLAHTALARRRLYSRTPLFSYSLTQTRGEE